MDIKFTYEDTDSYQNEISELYSYGEESEFFANRNAFEESMEDCGLPLAWKHMVPEQQSRAINHLMTTLEVSCRSTRIKSCRSLAYLVQGNFGECLSLEEQAKNSKENVFLLYQQGLFQAFVQQLLIEIYSNPTASNQQQTSITGSQIFNDSSDLRLILSVLCTVTETMYHAKDSKDLKILDLRQQFIYELQNPIGDELLTVTLFQMLNNFCSGLAPHYPVRKITILLWKVILITLGGTQKLKELKESRRRMTNLEPLSDDTMEVTKKMSAVAMMPDGQAGQSGGRSGIPEGVRKRGVFKQPAFDDIVFAYAKECLLTSLAELNQPDIDGTETAEGNGDFANEMNDSTENAQAPSDPNIEDPSDPEERRDESPMAVKNSDESSSDSGVSAHSEDNSERTVADPDNTDLVEVIDFEFPHRDMRENFPTVQVEFSSAKKEADHFEIDPVDITETDSEVWTKSFFDNKRETTNDSTTIAKGLPWSPKVRKADLSQHLSNIRQKFLGYILPNDLETTFGLPDPIVEGINVLKKHLYISLSEVQLEREEAMEKYPLTYKELDPEYRDLAPEKLYNALLPKLPQYMIALLKILLAASTSSKNKSERSESINIMSEINSESSASVVQSMKMNADANRHKEVIIKAVSAILILFLKHFKINHIYQFEYVSQQLMFANCIPLILKFLSQDIYSYVLTPTSTISAIDFPACVIGEQPELTTEAIALCSFQQPFCWRNMFSCINLVRILNKLTKWKHSRIMMLVVFKSAPTLTKALSVRHSLFQLYVLKLLKVQMKFLGRQWKKTNMKLISAIYQKVRHRLTDDWAYSNDNEARPWDFQAEEFTLQAHINKFHQRRYQDLLVSGNKARNNSIFNQSDKFGGFDDCIDEDYDFGNSEMSQISPHFEKNYERWLESEVFRRKIDWDKLLNN